MILCLGALHASAPDIPEAPGRLAELFCILPLRKQRLPVTHLISFSHKGAQTGLNQDTTSSPPSQFTIRGVKHFFANGMNKRPWSPGSNLNTRLPLNAIQKSLERAAQSSLLVCSPCYAKSSGRTLSEHHVSGPVLLLCFSSQQPHNPRGDTQPFTDMRLPWMIHSQRRHGKRKCLSFFALYYILTISYDGYIIFYKIRNDFFGRRLDANVNSPI